jgi:hypothetical protein
LCTQDEVLRLTVCTEHPDYIHQPATLVTNLNVENIGAGVDTGAGQNRIQRHDLASGHRFLDLTLIEAGLGLRGSGSRKSEGQRQSKGGSCRWFGSMCSHDPNSSDAMLNGT